MQVYIAILKCEGEEAAVIAATTEAGVMRRMGEVFIQFCEVLSEGDEARVQREQLEHDWAMLVDEGSTPDGFWSVEITETVLHEGD